MATVYLYIGMMKTGSTSIQRFLTDSAKELAERGYVYPKLMDGYRAKYRERNAHFLIYRSLLPTVQEKEAEQGALWRRSFDRLAVLAKQYEHIILSDEIVWYRHKRKDMWENLQKELAAIDCDFKVIVYIRRQDLFVESYWNQSVKGDPRNVLSFEECIEGGRFEFAELDYYKNLSAIASHIGRERLIVRVFERGCFKEGSLLKDFLSTVGLEMEVGEADSARFNEALSGDMCEIKREINSVPGYLEGKNFYCPMAVAIEDGNRRRGEYKKAHMFRPGRRTAFMERFEESNARVAREFLGREDGILFREPVRELDCWEREVDPFLSDMIRLFAMADTDLQRQLAELREENQKLKKRISRLENESFSTVIKRKTGGLLRQVGLRK